MSHRKQLSNNFWLHEFTNLSWGQLTSTNKFLLERLCIDILQPMRDYLCKVYDKNVPMSVTSGMRTAADFDRILAQGFNPSRRSDHFFANCIPTDGHGDTQRFGPYFAHGSGAADVVPTGEGVVVKDCFDHIVDGIRSGYLGIPFGQLIHEFGGRSSSGWLHLSNSKSLIFTDEMVKTLGFDSLHRILTSPDAGKSYVPVQL